MGRELNEPPSVEGVLHDVADGLVRGRIGVAAGGAVVGLASVLGWPPWPAAPLLIGALLFSAATLAFAIAAHHVPPAATTVRIVMVALLLGFDAAVFVGMAAVAQERAITTLLILPLSVSLLLHVRALTCIAAPRSCRPPSEGTPMVEAKPVPELSPVTALAEAIGSQAREAIGIVRARAEALRLAAEEAGVGELLGHDLDVLVRQAEECQRVLRELEQALDRHLRGAARLPGRAAALRRIAGGAPSGDEWPSESTPLRS